MKARVTIAIVVMLSLFWNSSSSRETHRLEPTQEILLRSNDYLDLLRRYWPRIRLGDVEAMVVSYEALNNCSYFREAIQKSENINDFDALMANEQQGMREFGRGIYYKCRELVDHYDDYPGWERLRLNAALAGDRYSQLMVVNDFYRYRGQNGFSRENISFSPAEFLIAALEDRDSKVCSLIAAAEAPGGMRKDSSKVTTAAWMLVGCEYNDNCEDPSSMEVFCTMMSSECTKYANVRELIRAVVDNDQQFVQAQERARDLMAKIASRDWEELGLDLVW